MRDLFFEHSMEGAWEDEEEYYEEAEFDEDGFPVENYEEAGAAGDDDERGGNGSGGNESSGDATGVNIKRDDPREAAPGLPPEEEPDFSLDGTWEPPDPANYDTFSKQHPYGKSYSYLPRYSFQFHSLGCRTGVARGTETALSDYRPRYPLEDRLRPVVEILNEQRRLSNSEAPLIMPVDPELSPRSREVLQKEIESMAAPPRPIATPSDRSSVRTYDTDVGDEVQPQRPLKRPVISRRHSALDRLESPPVGTTTTESGPRKESGGPTARRPQHDVDVRFSPFFDHAPFWNRDAAEEKPLADVFVPTLTSLRVLLQTHSQTNLFLHHGWAVGQLFAILAKMLVDEDLEEQIAFYIQVGIEPLADIQAGLVTAARFAGAVADYAAAAATGMPDVGGGRSGGGARDHSVRTDEVVAHLTKCASDLKIVLSVVRLACVRMCIFVEREIANALKMVHDAEKGGTAGGGGGPRSELHRKNSMATLIKQLAVELRDSQILPFEVDENSRIKMSPRPPSLSQQKRHPAGIKFSSTFLGRAALLASMVRAEEGIEHRPDAPAFLVLLSTRTGPSPASHKSSESRFRAVGYLRGKERRAALQSFLSAVQQTYNRSLHENDLQTRGGLFELLQSLFRVADPQRSGFVKCAAVAALLEGLKIKGGANAVVSAVDGGAGDGRVVMDWSKSCTQLMLGEFHESGVKMVAFGQWLWRCLEAMQDGNFVMGAVCAELDLLAKFGVRDPPGVGQGRV